MVLYKTSLDSNRLPVLEKVKEVTCKDTVDNAGDLANILYQLRHDKETEEVTYMFCLNPSMKIIGCFKVSVGSMTGSLINPEIIFKKALLCGAYGIVIAHNHPTGEIKPSKEDCTIFNRIRECGRLMNISLFDFLVIGEGYLSFAEAGYYEVTDNAKSKTRKGKGERYEDI